jgi:hypothetical protein
MYRDVLQVMHVLATAILMLLAGQLKDVAFKILEGHHVCNERGDGLSGRRDSDAVRDLQRAPD